MPYLDINTLSTNELRQQISTHPNVIACLCAAWCDVCNSWRPHFKTLADQFPDRLFLWIDIEDQAALVGDMEVENFPTLLIQQHELVTFYGAMEPETGLVKRLIHSLEKQTPEQLQQDATKGEKRFWQTEANLISKLNKMR